VADTPALPERLSDEHLARLPSEYPDDPFVARAVAEAQAARTAASPRREAPADAVGALYEVLHDIAPEVDWAQVSAPVLAAALAERNVRVVPADHHVSRVGHVWKDGRLWRVEIHVEDDGSERVCPRAYLRPVGTEEADTDAE
jgi:hypothetical protein